MTVNHLDHFVLTVKSIQHTCQFYATALGMDVLEFGAGRIALIFGNQKINLHEKGKEFEPKAHKPTPGSADLCFVTALEIDEVIKHLTSCGITIIEGPVKRTGARGPITSVYVRDPDLNLVEIANYGD